MHLPFFLAQFGYDSWTFASWASITWVPRSASKAVTLMKLLHLLAQALPPPSPTQSVQDEPQLPHFSKQPWPPPVLTHEAQALQPTPPPTPPPSPPPEPEVVVQIVKKKKKKKKPPEHYWRHKEDRVESATYGWSAHKGHHFASDNKQRAAAASRPTDRKKHFAAQFKKKM